MKKRNKDEWTRADTNLIRVSKATKEKIDKLAVRMGYKQLTTLEYLLSGQIELEELNKLL